MTSTEDARPTTQAASATAEHGTNAERSTSVLDAERDFLLRSIADLDAERDAGELSPVRYQELHDYYTVQAATVLRAIDRLNTSRLNTSQPDATSPPRAAGRSRRLLLIVTVTAVLLLSGAGLLARSLTDRQPGGTITGNAQSATPDLTALAQAVQDRPDDARAQLDYASALLQANRPVDALRAFDTAARLDPADPAPKAYAGWILFLAGLTDQALPRLDTVVTADPAYPDAHFFRGMVLLRGREDRAGSLTEPSATISGAAQREAAG